MATKCCITNGIKREIDNNSNSEAEKKKNTVSKHRRISRSYTHNNTSSVFMYSCTGNVHTHMYNKKCGYSSFVFLAPKNILLNSLSHFSFRTKIPFHIHSVPRYTHHLFSFTSFLCGVQSFTFCFSKRMQKQTNVLLWFNFSTNNVFKIPQFCLFYLLIFPHSYCRIISVNRVR